jgi:hypothetical protein
MADKKITEATAISVVAGTDLVPVATPSVATAFKATFAQIATYIASALSINIGTTATALNRASATQVLTGIVPVENVITKGSVSGSQAVDWDTGTICTITMTGATTFTDSNASAGQTMVYYLKQDATGSKTVTWPTTTWLEGGTAPTLTTTANKTDVIVRYFDGTVYWGYVGGKNG